MFDQDVNNQVFKVPEDVNSTIFYLYMSGKAYSKDNSKKPEQMDENEKIIQALREIMLKKHETQISNSKIDSDESILTPFLTGKGAKSGTIGEDHTVIL